MHQSPLQCMWTATQGCLGTCPTAWRAGWGRAGALKSQGWTSPTTALNSSLGQVFRQAVLTALAAAAMLRFSATAQPVGQSASCLILCHSAHDELYNGFSQCMLCTVYKKLHRALHLAVQRFIHYGRLYTYYSRYAQKAYSLQPVLVSRCGFMRLPFSLADCCRQCLAALHHAQLHALQPNYARQYSTCRLQWLWMCYHQGACPAARGCCSSS